MALASESRPLQWSAGKDAKFLNKLCRLLGKIDEEGRRLILHMARKMVGRG